MALLVDYLAGVCDRLAVLVLVVASILTVAALIVALCWAFAVHDRRNDLYSSLRCTFWLNTVLAAVMWIALLFIPLGRTIRMLDTNTAPPKTFTDTLVGAEENPADAQG